ncbi:MAG TPA: deoxyribonuclease IV [Candidatus Onthousia excrementipullorum]|uniref:Probable endonuclease 4 n=1 Tax=Candidatus Onthousia excrementipullorum TaxID=2840884 RepID=A0A9D1DTQ1_9FIRM|nr:deoxyribonuclease IV [Candidatus Onthousia excrementipullorum]
MLIIGSHVGYKKDSGLVGSVEEALSYGANTFMFYTGAPQNTIRSSIDLDNVKKAYTLMEENGIDKNKVIVHAPYIINLANGDESKFNFSCNFLSEELKRVDTFGMKYLVLHPGSHVGQGVDEGISNIVKALNLVLDKDNSNVMILLETMAGKGSEVGRNFEEIKSIIDGVSKKDRVGVCLDTCHLNDAGYDLNNFDEVLDSFDKLIGINKIKCIHINDSKNPIDSHKDRHENIGKGTIGLDTLIKVIDCDKLKDVPKILETPYIDGHAPYKEEISLIRSLSKQ